MVKSKLLLEKGKGGKQGKLWTVILMAVWVGAAKKRAKKNKQLGYILDEWLTTE